jgi:peptidyl-tRNA hydrolase
VRKDLKPGAKLAQSCHVALSFREEHSELAVQWLKDSNYICILEIENEEELRNLQKKAAMLGIPNSSFIEPDFDNSLTAVAFAPVLESKKLCSNLKLALRGD